MTVKDDIAAIKVSDVLRPKGRDEVPVNSHLIQERSAPQPDYEAMRRTISGENEDDRESIVAD
ncbi:MAG: hypothetical protein GDA49_13495 [Rhodospirillales bacterium]|nr:hypothetical protein [Rhodospirillales bacterium]